MPETIYKKVWTQLAFNEDYSLVVPSAEYLITDGTAVYPRLIVGEQYSVALASLDSQLDALDAAAEDSLAP